ncbi:acyl-CoA N-acyltransferase [Dacryopinax primogenitus]|uniref:Acyl-CoA N-acyltransferase n=1 Tax=Dacryopinax primogenitus (strain DJM 731) TaxID=1858805 RepID=M5FXQ0_DACPD|nr:acyl-CoA N-acyltransferase [Dacryopinax primogenitus]EJU01269.1 acyl-CoA N-acyltransferase [Dacryopinax primogenitus]
MEDSFLSKALLVVVIEVKREYAGLRKWDEDEEKRKDEEKTPQDWARELYAGYAALSPKHPKNRDAEVGITLVVPWWGNGFATEVTEWVLQHAFEQLALHRVSLGYFGNPAARRVYDKCGFVQEGVNRKAFWVDGHWVDEVTMGIIDEEYWAKKRALQP